MYCVVGVVLCGELDVVWMIECCDCFVVIELD